MTTRDARMAENQNRYPENYVDEKRRVRASSFFTDNVLRSLVLAHAEEGGVSHLSGRRPFRELDFGHQLRLHPARDSLVLNPLLEWGAVGSQR
jgi:hypothetical protein